MRRGAIFGGGPGSDLLIDIIEELGYGSNALLVLDASDPLCYSGSGQIVNNLGSAAIDFRFGNLTTADAADPTFTSVAGLQSYFSMASGDLLEYNTGTFSDLDPLYDGSTLVTVIAVARVAAVAASLLQTTGGGANEVGLQTNSTPKTFSTYKAAQATPTNALSTGVDRFIAMAGDPGAGEMRIVDSNNTGGFTDPGNTMPANTGVGNVNSTSTSRFYCGAMLAGVGMSIAQMQAFRTRLLTRFTAI